MNNPLKILLLEDSSDDVWLIKRQMERAAMACEWVVVREGDEFTEALETFQPDVVLADHSLPGFSSIEAFEIFKKYHDDRKAVKPFILVTGGVSEDFAMQRLTAGVDDFILKDRLKRLPSAIARALEKCRLENERQKYLRQVVLKEALMKDAEHMAGLGSWQRDLINNITVWSDETYAIYGYSPDEVEPSYELFLKLVHPEDRSMLEADFAHILKDASSWTREFRIIDANGKIKYISGKLEVCRDPDGNPLRLVGFNLDITEKKRLEHELDRVYRTAMIGRWDLNVGEDKLWWSSVTCELHEVPLDYTPDVESAISFYKQGRSRDAIRRAVDLGMKTGKPWTEELTIVTASGKERWIRATGQAEMKNGKPVRLYGTFQDIHALKQAEEALHSAREDKAMLLERIHDAFIALDTKGIVTYWNNSAESLVKVPRENTLGKKIWEILPDIIGPDDYKKFRMRLRTGEPIRFEEYYPKRALAVKGSIYPTTSGVTVHLKDTSVERMRMQELEEQDAQLKEITLLQSQELRASLTRIRELIELIDDGVDRREELSEILRAIRINAAQLEGMIRSVGIKADYDNQD